MRLRQALWIVRCPSRRDHALDHLRPDAATPVENALDVAGSTPAPRAIAM